MSQHQRKPSKSTLPSRLASSSKPKENVLGGPDLEPTPAPVPKPQSPTRLPISSSSGLPRHGAKARSANVIAAAAGKSGSPTPVNDGEAEPEKSIQPPSADSESRPVRKLPLTRQGPTESSTRSTAANTTLARTRSAHVRTSSTNKPASAALSQPSNRQIPGPSTDRRQTSSGQVRPRGASQASINAEASRTSSIRITSGRSAAKDAADSSTRHRPGRSVDTAAATAPKLKEASHVDRTKVAKPSFSTFQQHFSPKKAPASRSTPTSSTATVLDRLAPATGLSSETTRQQMDLLQLYVLHEQSCATQRQWESSCRAKLEDKFSNLVQIHDSLRAQEDEVQKQINLQAFEKWDSLEGAMGLSESLRILGSVIEDVLELTGRSGQFTASIEEFEAWTGLGKDNDDGDDAWEAGEDHITADISQSWKDYASATSRKIADLARQLGTLESSTPESSLGRLLGCAQDMVGTMQTEMQMMSSIVREASKREQERAERELAEIADEVENLSKMPTHAPKRAWQISLV